MSVQGISLHHSIPNSPFSYLSVPQSAFLGPPRRTKLANNTLGKRSRSYRHSPQLTDEQCQKRRRITAPERYALSGHGHPPSPLPPQAAQWHQSDRFVRKFNRDEFERALAVTPTISSQIAQFPLGNDTEFPIHPIFRSLTGLIPELYPSLCLASRFLFSRQTLPFFHNLITSPLTFLQFESRYYNAPLTHLAPSPYQATGLPGSERDLTIRTILSLVPHITLQISPDPRLAVRWAYTERVTPPQHSTTGLASAYSILPQLFPTPAQLHTNNIFQPNSINPLLALKFRGSNALINISPCFLRTLHPHTFPAPSLAQKFRCAFMLAVTLVHEVAHAIYMCRFPGAPLIPEANPPAPTPAPRAGPTPPPPGSGPNSSPSPEPSPARPCPRPHPHTPLHTLKTSLSNGKTFPRLLASRLTNITTTTSSSSPPSSSNLRKRKAYEDQEPFYGLHRKPELGHAWETAVFAGGKILSLASCDRFSVGLGWQRWPGADECYVANWRGETVPLCRRTGLRRGEGGEGEGRPSGIPKWETVYVVSDAWVWKWFLRGFWERVEVEGLEALGRVEKGLGARVRNYDWVDRGGGDDGWGCDCSSRERGADVEGVVRLGQAWVESESEVDEDEDEDED